MRIFLSRAKSEKTLALASFRGNMHFAVAPKQVRRLRGTRGGAVRPSFSVAADAEVHSEEESDYAAWVEKEGNKRKEERGRRTAMGKKWR